MAIEIDSETARLLTEIGFLGISRGLPAESSAVFAALRLLRPDSEGAAIGAGLAALGRGDAAAAVAHLRDAPQTEPVLAFRCIAHARLGERDVALELRDDLVAMGAGDDLIAITNAATGKV